MKKQFLIVPTVGDSYHVIDFNLIESICPKEGKENKSTITLIGKGDCFYSTETPLQIFERIKLLHPE